MTEQQKKDLGEWILTAYSAVLPRNGTFTFKQLATEIPKVYSVENPVNAAAVEWLNENHGIINRINGATKIGFLGVKET